MHRKTIFEKVAEKFHTTPEEVYAEIQRAIDAGYKNVICDNTYILHKERI